MKSVSIIYEDEDLLVLNKPAGLLVHPPKIPQTASHEPTLVEWLVFRYPQIKNVGDDPKLRPGIVHRLDKETSGILLVAKTQKYFSYLKSLFQENKIRKIYLALAFGKVEPKIGIIDKPIRLKSGTIRRTIHSGKMEKSAVTEYRVFKYLKEPQSGEILTLLEVIPKTGRTHQIRVHLASLGHPVFGDKIYGSKQKSAIATRLMLHAFSLEFTTLEGKRLKLEAEPPSDFESVIKGLGML